jgi:predicted NACHT family NTPase
MWTEKTEHPWEETLELPDQTSRRLLPGEPIDKLFFEVGRSLLILGAPGSGKTITLLTLARELIARAEDDPAQPIPVIFNLSSWNDPRRNLLDWLIDELQAKYQVPKRIASRWLEANWLVALMR